MTINIADNSPRISYSVASGVTQTSFAVPFEFFDDEDLNVYVDGVEKSLTTDFTVSGGDGSTGTVTISVTGASGGSTVVITRDIPLERTTDFPVSGAFNIVALNTELDRLVAVAADLNDLASRAITPLDYDPTVSYTLPTVDNRKGKTLAFNEVTGSVEAGPSIADTQSVADASSDIALLADIQDGTVATNAITTAANVSSQIATLGAISSDITTVSGISSNVTTVASNDANVTTVAGISSNVTTVADNIADINTVADDLNEAVSEINTVATDITNVNTVGTNITNVNTTAGSINNVNTVASDITNVNTVSTNISNVNTVAGISANVTTVAGQTTNLQNVTDNLTAIQNAASNATSASDSATAAAASAAAAALSADTFDDTYLGSKASDPSLDNDGDALNAGDLYFNTTSNTLKVYSGSAWQDAAVDSSGFVQTTGDTMTGNLSFGDNDKAIFGAGSDLQIYHDGSASFITDSGTGNLKIQGTQLQLQNAAGTLSYLAGVDGGATSIHYAGYTKLATTSTGIDVTGTVTADGLTVDGDSFVTTRTINGATVNINTRFRPDNEGGLEIGSADGGVDAYLHSLASGGSITLSNRTGGTDYRRLNISSGGDISFYEDTGTTAKFFWDASAESLGIGTSSPQRPLHVDGAEGVARFTSTASGNNGFEVGIGASSQAFLWQSENSYMQFATNATERMRIDSSGNLLVSTTGNTPATGTNTGIALKSNDTIEVGTSGAAPLLLNRTSNDGNIAVFRRDGTTVGSIGASNGDVFIGTGDTGIRFKDDTDDIRPWNTSTNALTDGTIDLGDSIARFKDLYLSGGVYLGGTGSANKLDDYESGDIDISTMYFANSGSAITNSAYDTLRYVKVGSQVTITGNIYFDSVTSQNGALKIPLPFANGTGEKFRTVGIIGNFQSNTTTVVKIDSGQSFGLMVNPYLWGTVTVSANQTYVVNVTYNT